MRKVNFIRHAESEGNAGLVTYSDAEMTLSATGEQQARELAKTILQRPDLVVVSSFRRTVLTAGPLLERFAGVPLVTLPIHEFTYLSPAACVGTTAHQRKNWVVDYWERNDPDLVHGEGAESFSQFADRVSFCLDLVIKLPYESIMVFTHGHVMRMIWQLLGERKFTNGAEQMRDFYQRMSLLPVSNCCVFKAEIEAGEMKIIEPILKPRKFSLRSIVKTQP